MLPSRTHISDRIARIVAMVDLGEWKRSRIPAYRIISECEALLERPRVLAMLTDSERQWLIGAVVWVSESLEDAARGEGVYLD